MDRISNAIVNLFASDEEVERRDIYKYGINILLSDLSNLLVIIIPSLIMNRLLEGVVFLITFISIRRYCGGYHCSSCIRCNISFLCIFLLSLMSYNIEIVTLHVIFALSVITIIYITWKDTFIEMKFKKKTLLHLLIIPTFAYMIKPSVIPQVEFTIIVICCLLLMQRKVKLNG